MRRIGPKRIGPGLPHIQVTTERMSELIDIIADQNYVFGPLDEADMVHALRELADRRRGEYLASLLRAPIERSAA